MGGNDDVHGAAQGHQQVQEAAALVRVEPCGGLVQEQYLGLVDEGARDGDALLLTAGERLDAVVHLFGKPYTIDRCGGGRPGVTLPHPLEPADVRHMLTSGQSW